MCNRARSRVNCLRRLKKVGLGIRHASQFSACARMGLVFGLYWITALSKTEFDKLETCWSNLLRKTCHEKTPKYAKITVLHEVSGFCSLRDFVNYLLHLRTNKDMKCKNFTLTHGELESTKSKINSQTCVSATRHVRNCTRKQTSDLTIKLQNQKTRFELGFIKDYTYELAMANNWTNLEFKMDKSTLRTRYSVARKTSKHASDMTNDELLHYLKGDQRF